MESVKSVESCIKAAPKQPGVYLFKRHDGAVVYIGKARVLRSRLQSYLAGYGSEWKATSIIDGSDLVEWQVTESELAALLLEARLVQSYQPPFNVLLKTGQPYVYFLITQDQLPRFELARSKQKRGTYFGPFIDKGAARASFRFLQHAFQLFVCGRSIEGGCLAYHLGKCAGVCRSDFDLVGYKERLELLEQGLRSKPEVMLGKIDWLIQASNEAMQFERSMKLTSYKKALERIYESMATGFDRPQSIQRLAEKDIWMWCPPRAEEPLGHLFLFREKRGVLKKERVWCVALTEETQAQDIANYLFGYYRFYRPSPQVLVSEPFADQALLGQFLQEWHQLSHLISVDAPARAEHVDLMMHARVYAQEEVSRPERLASQLKLLLKLKRLPRRIDCFDISHKQGHAMVGACVRFVDGRPDHTGIRHFHIRTLEQQNDYAALQEIVLRRYKSAADLPDLIVIDGGKGQLSAVRAVLSDLLRESDVGLVSLAKREETVFSVEFPEGKILRGDLVSHGSLVGLRDYAHHHAISFHRKSFNPFTSESE